MTVNRDVYARVFESVISEMEQGRAPWIRSWAGGSDMPYNATTGRPYHGGNVLALWLAGIPYASGGWCTFKQAIAAQCVVRKGEKSTAVYYMSVNVRKPKDGSEKGDRFFFAKLFHVFNVEQLDELAPGALATLRARHETMLTASPFERLEAAEATVQATGANVQIRGSQPAYYPTTDHIEIPEPGTFTSREAYYATLFHELAHWTGAASRLDRGKGNRFGSPEYAFEELVAELGAAFLAARHGLEHVTQAAAYLRHWAKACREMPDMFARAASLSQAAATYVMPEIVPEEIEADLVSTY